MIAKIKTKNGIYETIVFATIEDGWKSKLVGFNEKKDKVEFINYWGTRQYQGNNCIARYVFIIDANEENWVKHDKIKGYDWFINNLNLLNQTEGLIEIDAKIYKKCQDLQINMRLNEWKNIITYEDINSILYASLDFHDSIVEKIDMNKVDQNLEVTFDTTWECKIIIRFENQVEFRCEEQYGAMGEIFHGSLFFENDFLYWVDSDIDSFQDIDKEMCFFKSRKASWKIEIV